MRWDIINYLIEKNKYVDYLEIGVQDYYSCCDKIQASNKTSVDPFPRNLCDFVGTSDDFFNQLAEDVKYDIIFIDGLHQEEQVSKDIYNSLKHLRPNGTIVVHDCLPSSERMQERENHGGEWTGDVWKAIAKLKSYRSDLNIKVVNHDYGCGVIQFGHQDLIKIQENLDYTYFSENKNRIMSVISYDEFLNIYNGKN